MVARKQNLLEAFRAAAPESRDAQKRSSTPPPAAGGPFAAPKAALERDTARLQFFDAPRKPFLERVFGDRVVQLVLVLAVVAIGAAFLFKRGPSEPGTSGDAVQAAAASALPSSNPALNPVTPVDAGDSAVAPAAATPPSNASEHDKAFYDVANKYTVRVAQYNNDDAGLKAARAAVAYLMKDGYPAVQPIQSGDGSALIVCVGAEPKAKDIEVLQKDLKQLRGPPPQPKKLPFRDAYIVRIDDVLRRQ